MEHSFNTEVAEIYGIEGAVIIHNLFFWIKKNKANQKHFYEGRYWTYNTLNAWAELFPYFAPIVEGKNGKQPYRRTDKVQRIIKSLEDSGAIIKGNFNPTAYDRTIWYALSDECLSHYQKMDNSESHNGVSEIAKSILRNRIMDNAESNNRKCEIASPIPYSNTDIKTQIENTYSKPKTEKILFLDCVKLTSEEYQKLIEFFGSEEKAMAKIQVLNDYVMSKGKKYASHYHTILNWNRMEKDNKTTSTQFNPLKGRLKPDGSPYRIMTPEEGEEQYDLIMMSPKPDYIITETGKYIALDWDNMTKFPSQGNFEFPLVKGSTKIKRLPEDEKKAYCKFFSIDISDLQLNSI